MPPARYGRPAIRAANSALRSPAKTRCACESANPGSTARPAASTAVSVAGARDAGPVHATRSPSMTSAALVTSSPIPVISMLSGSDTEPACHYVSDSLERRPGSRPPWPAWHHRPHELGPAGGLPPLTAEDPAYAEEMGPWGVPDAPHRPFPPRYLPGAAHHGPLPASRGARAPGGPAPGAGPGRPAAASGRRRGRADASAGSPGTT